MREDYFGARAVIVNLHANVQVGARMGSYHAGHRALGAGGSLYVDCREPALPNGHRAKGAATINKTEWAGGTHSGR